MKTTVTKWGKAIGIRIPRYIAEDAKIRAGQELDISLVRGEIRIKKLRFILAELTKNITKKNVHDSVDWGRPRGKEVW